VIKEIDKLNEKAEKLYNLDPEKSIAKSIIAVKKSKEANYKKGEINAFLNLAGANYRKHNMKKAESFVAFTLYSIKFSIFKKRN